MSQKKKMFLIIGAIILVLAIITGVIAWTQLGNKTEATLEKGNSKINQLYSELAEKQAFQFIATVDNENKIYYAKNDKKAYIDTIYKGNETKFIIKDGNSYLVIDDEKTYYTYQNNEINLDKMVLQLEEIKEKQAKTGKEKIDKKEYKYEEYEGTTDFLLKDIETSQERTAKTRFYFDGDKLVYIKTIVGEEQEVLKIDMSYNVNDNLFEIPSDYEEG